MNINLLTFIAAFFRKLSIVNYRHLVLIVIVAEIITACMNSVMGLLWLGHVSLDLILIGSVDALFASILVGVPVLFIYARFIENSKKYRELVEHANSIILRMDNNGNVTFFNEFAQQFFGYEEGEILGRNVIGTIVPEQESTGRDLIYMIHDILTNPDRYIMNTNENMKKTGERVWVSWTNRPVLDQRGQISEILCIGQDITEIRKTNEKLQTYRLQLEELVKTRTAELTTTIGRLEHEIAERKMVEQALLFAQEKFLKAFRASPDWITISALNDGRYIEVNDAFLQSSGYARDEVIGRTSEELGLWAESQNRDTMIQSILQQGFSSNQEVRFRTRSGTMLTMLRSSELIEIEGEQFIISVTRDITGRKMAEEALSESEERFRAIFEQNGDALIVLDPRDCRVIDANPAALALYDVPREEFLSQGLTLIFDQPDLAGFSAHISNIHTGNPLRIDRLKCRKKDGTPLIVSARGTSVRLRNNDVLFLSFRDMSEKIRMDEEIQSIQSNLIHTNKMTSLGMMVSGISHEINNPNNFIMVNSQMIGDAWNDALGILSEYHQKDADFTLGGVPFSEMRYIMPRLLAGITEGSGRIRDIIENLKDFVRQEKGAHDSMVDLLKVINASVMILSSQIKKYTDHFIMRTESDLPPVLGSRQQLEQVIINILMNALQSLPDRSRGINISSGFDSAAGNVIIEIQDEGTGMSQDVLEHATEPFFTTRLSEGGTGLGLSISHAIIKEHNGSLKFSSLPGKGTTASIVLPAAPASRERN